MTRKDLYLSTFKGYPEWDADTQAESIEALIATYSHWLAKYSPAQTYSLEERIDDIRFMIEIDLIEYEQKEQYEICSILRDSLELL